MPTRTIAIDETPGFRPLAQMPIALSDRVCRQSVEHLNQLLADTITLRDLYKRCRRQTPGPASDVLRALFDTHAERQSELADALAERVQTLGGLSLAMAHDVAEATAIPRPPRRREEATAQIDRLLEAHAIVLEEARTMARLAAERGDEGTNDLIVSDVIRGNEEQVWFVSGHFLEAAHEPDGEPA